MLERRRYTIVTDGALDALKKSASHYSRARVTRLELETLYVVNPPDTGERVVLHVFMLPTEPVSNLGVIYDNCTISNRFLVPFGLLYTRICCGGTVSQRK